MKKINFLICFAVFLVFGISVVNGADPSLSTSTEYPADPSTYSSGQVYEFNATLVDADGSDTIETVLFEWNGANYTHPYSNQQSGLVGYWKFNSNATHQADVSGEGNDGTFSGETFNDGTLENSPTWTTGQYGGALEFDGDDYVDLGYESDSILAGLTEFTISAILKPTSTGTNTIIGEGKIIGSNSSTFFLRPDIFELATENNNDARLDWSFNTDEWEHLIITYNSTGMYAYKDGSLVDSNEDVSGAVRDEYDGCVSIGGGSCGTLEMMDGTIDEVQIWNRGLSSDEILDIYNSNTHIREGLVGEWRFDEGTGSTAYDTHNLISPYNGNNKYGYSVEFDGDDDYIDAGDDFKFNDTISICSWVNLNELNGYQHIAHRRAGNYGFWLSNDGTNWEWRIYDNSDSVAYDSSESSTANQWVHICGVSDSGHNYLYINGNAEVDTDDGQTYKSVQGAKDLGIGAEDDDSDGNFNLNGTIDEVMIYDRALSEDEILNLYNRSAYYYVPGSSQSTTTDEFTSSDKLDSFTNTRRSTLANSAEELTGKILLEADSGHETYYDKFTDGVKPTYTTNYGTLTESGGVLEVDAEEKYSRMEVTESWTKIDYDFRFTSTPFSPYVETVFYSGTGSTGLKIDIDHGGNFYVRRHDGGQWLTSGGTWQASQTPCGSYSDDTWYDFLIKVNGVNADIFTDGICPNATTSWSQATGVWSFGSVADIFNYTLEIDNLKYNYEDFSSTGNVISDTMDSSEDTIYNATLDWSDSTPGSTKIFYWMAADGSAWENVTGEKGTMHTFSTTGSDLKWKANFTGGSDDLPYIENISLTLPSTEGEKYMYRVINLPKGEYDYVWYANDTGGGTTLLSGNYTVEGIASNLVLSSSAGWSTTRETETAITCTADIDTSLYKDGLLVASPYTFTPIVGSYNFTCYVDDLNYTPYSITENLVVQSGGGCTSNSTFAFSKDIDVTGTKHNIDFGSFVSDYLVKSDLSDVYVNTTNTTTYKNGTKLVVDTTNVTSIQVLFGNYYAKYSWPNTTLSANTTTITTYDEVNENHLVRFFNEMNGTNMLPPGTNYTQFKIFCDNGETNFNISDSNILVTVFSPANRIKSTVVYDVSDIYHRTLKIDSPDDPKEFYLADANNNQVVQNQFILQDNTGSYDDAWIHIKKYYEGDLIDVTETPFDVEDRALAYLVNGEEYQISVTSGSLERSIGNIVIDTTNLIKNILISTNQAFNTSEGNFSTDLSFDWDTSTITLSVMDTNSNINITEFFVYNGSNHSQQLYYAVSFNTSEVTMTYVVPDRNATYYAGMEVHHNIYGQNTYEMFKTFGGFVKFVTEIPGFSEIVLVFICTMGLLLLPMMFDPVHGAMGGIITCVVALILYTIGAYPVQGTIIILALFLAVLNKISGGKK